MAIETRAAKDEPTAAPAPPPPPDVTGRLVPPAFRPVIATDRLLLRPLRPSDVPDMVAGVDDLAVSKMLARVPHPYTAADAAAAVASAKANAIARRGINSAVTLRGRLIGQVGLNSIHVQNRMGYWLARQHWGRGYATEAVAAVVAYAFEVLELPFVRAGVFADNPASLRVLVKLGFRRIGIRTSLSLARGQRLEHIATVLTRTRYREHRR
jgi:RimJ/RimL family protein N-acetyltransferase